MSPLHPFRRERLLRGLTQRECALRAGMGQPKVSLIESGFILPSAIEAEKLAALVEGNPSVLFPETTSALKAQKVARGQ